MKNDAGEPVKTWKPGEWEAWQKEVEARNTALDEQDTKTVEEMIAKGQSRGQVPNVTTADAASEAVEAGRADGPGLNPQVTSGFDLAAEDGGTLVAGVGATAFGAVVLGPEAFKIGVDIGNGIDSLFGFPEWNPGEEEEEARKAFEREGDGGFCELADEPTGYTASEPYNEAKEKGPPGLYELCGPSGAYSSTSHKTWDKPKAGEPGPGEWDPYTMPIELNHVSGELKLNECHDETGFEYTVCQYDIWAYEENNCEPNEEPGIDNCGPEGLPAPGLLTSGQEHENAEHGVSEHPEPTGIPPQPSLDEAHHPSMTEKQMQEASQDLPADEFTEREGKKTPKELEEVEAAEPLKEIPFPNTGETATQYKDLLEGEGFTNVSVKPLGEANENPEVGPNGVAGEDPTAGSKVKPETHVEVDENPSNAPVPTEPHTPPGIPSIKWPAVPELCTTFPFGIPCWLYKQVKELSVEAEAPKVELSIYKTKFTVSLAELEPVMEIVRPALLILSIVGLVFMFGGFVKPGGSGND
jgi:hypothetical protein